MKWSWRLGTFAGIGVYMHATFLLLLGYVGYVHWREQQTVAAVAAGIAFILAIFACVVLHEFGHALTARRFGIRTRDITLLPIGGVARLERMPDQPMQEFWVAVAGPAVNVAIALALFGYLVFTQTIGPVATLGVTGGGFLERLLAVNVLLVVFNLVPAFPMDGGRILRALLALKLEYTRATQIAAWLGQAIALAFGFLGLFGNPFLLFIALFVWIGAAQEASMVQMKSALGGIPVTHAMLTDVRTLTPEDTLGHAVDVLLTQSQQDFPVVQGSAVVGVLVRGDLLAALTQRGRDARVIEVMRRDFQAVDAAEMLETALQRLQECACHTLPVLRAGRLVGLVTMDNVGEFVAVQAALEKRGARSGQR